MRKQWLVVMFVTSAGLALTTSCKKNSNGDDAPPGATPRIDAFAPGSAAKDSIVVITGDNFSTVAAENVVTFASVPATVVTAGKTRLEVKVPTGAGNGKITIKVGGGVTSSANDFSYLFTVTTLAGNGNYGFVNGPGDIAEFKSSFGIKTDAAGNVYIADGGNNAVRKITPGGIVSTLAGDGTAGARNGAGSSAQFYFPHGVAADATGNVYVADAGNNTIRKITVLANGTTTVSTIAGSGADGYADGPAATAKFSFPSDVVVDAAGNLYVTDGNNSRIRKITFSANGTEVSTLGTATPGFPEQLAIDATGNLYFADAANHVVRKMTPAGVSTILAGTGVGGYTNGAGTVARFFNPEGVAVDTLGNVYVGDLSNQAIRKITPQPNGTVVVSTVAGANTSGYVNAVAGAARFSNPSGIAIDANGKIYVTDVGNVRIRKLE